MSYLIGYFNGQTITHPALSISLGVGIIFFQHFCDQISCFPRFVFFFVKRIVSSLRHVNKIGCVNLKEWFCVHLINVNMTSRNFHEKSLICVKRWKWIWITSDKAFTLPKKSSHSEFYCGSNFWTSIQVNQVIFFEHGALKTKGFLLEGMLNWLKSLN